MSQSHFPFAVDRLVKKDRAIALTTPFWGDMSKVVTLSWRMWATFDEKHRAILSETPHVPAINIWSLTQHFAKELFSHRENDGIVVCDQLPGVFAFYIQNEVLIRFNTFDDKLVVQNGFNPSERREQYFLQEQIDGLNNGATRLTVGHVANETRTDAELIAISCQIGEFCHYAFRIDGGDESVLPIPTPSEAPVPDLHSEQLKTTKPR